MVLLSLPDISGRLRILEDIAMFFVTDTEVIQLIQLGKALTDSQQRMTGILKRRIMSIQRMSNVAKCTGVKLVARGELDS